MKKYLLLMVIWFFPLFGFAQDVPVYTDSQQMISVNAAQPAFIIQLKSNPTTGYAWSLKDYDSSHLKLIRHEYIQPDKKLMGAPGVEEWEFEVDPSAFKSRLTFRLEFVYKRSWEDQSLAKLVTFNIQTL